MTSAHTAKLQSLKVAARSLAGSLKCLAARQGAVGGCRLKLIRQPETLQLFNKHGQKLIPIAFAILRVDIFLTASKLIS